MFLVGVTGDFEIMMFLYPRKLKCVEILKYQILYKGYKSFKGDPCNDEL